LTIAFSCLRSPLLLFVVVIHVVPVALPHCDVVAILRCCCSPLLLPTWLFTLLPYADPFSRCCVVARFAFVYVCVSFLHVVVYVTFALHGLRLLVRFRLLHTLLRFYVALVCPFGSFVYIRLVRYGVVTGFVVVAGLRLLRSGLLLDPVPLDCSFGCHVTRLPRSVPSHTRLRFTLLRSVWFVDLFTTHVLPPRYVAHV